MDHYNQQLTRSWVADIGEFPLYAKATVVTGFGRGSKQMGIPTGKHMLVTFVLQHLSWKAEENLTHDYG